MKTNLSTGFTVKPLYPNGINSETKSINKSEVDSMTNDEITSYARKSIEISGLIFTASKFGNGNDLGTKLFKPEYYSNGSAFKEIYDLVSLRALDLESCYKAYDNLDFNKKKEIAEAIASMDSQMLKVITKKVAADLKELSKILDEAVESTNSVLN